MQSLMSTVDISGLYTVSNKAINLLIVSHTIINSFSRALNKSNATLFLVQFGNFAPTFRDY